MGGAARPAGGRSGRAPVAADWTNVPSAGGWTLPIVPMMRSDQPKVTCTECSFEWFGDTAAHGLRTVGACTRCGGKLRFAEEPSLPVLIEPAANVPAHLVLGAPRY